MINMQDRLYIIATENYHIFYEISQLFDCIDDPEVLCALLMTIASSALKKANALDAMEALGHNLIKGAEIFRTIGVNSFSEDEDEPDRIETEFGPIEQFWEDNTDPTPQEVTEYSGYHCDRVVHIKRPEGVDDAAWERMMETTSMCHPTIAFVETVSAED